MAQCQITRRGGGVKKEYIYKAGVWNPAYEKTQSAGVVFESNMIKITPNSTLTISKKVDLLSKNKIVCAYKSTGYSGTINYGYNIGVSIYNQSQTNVGTAVEIPISLSGVNITKELGLVNNEIDKCAISSGALQTTTISEIWIE